VDHLIDICPKCKSPHNVVSHDKNLRRRGPAVIRYGPKQYRVICLACWKLGFIRTTATKAIESWNSGEDYNKNYIPKHAVRLRKLRTEKGLSQRVLAEKAGLAKNTVYTIEHGDKFPKPETVEKLESVLGSPIFI
jgi:ribosome-binding protein aMBF1 (putative translation factor)